MNSENLGTDRVCDASRCGQVGAGYSLKSCMCPNPKNPKKDMLALVISVTDTPPTIDGEVNPDHDPSKITPVAWLEGRWDFCDRDCLAGIIDEMFVNVERRRKKLWSKKNPS